MKKLPQGEALDVLAAELGVDTKGEPVPLDQRKSRDALVAQRERVSDYELQHRVLEALRARRESRTWWLAVISAIASVISAVTALVALLVTRGP